MLPSRNHVTYRTFADEIRTGDATPTHVVQRMRQLFLAHYSTRDIAHLTGYSETTVRRYTENLTRDEFRVVTSEQRDALLRSWACNRRIETPWR